MNQINKMVLLANFIAISIVLNLVEAQLAFIPVPGAKIGLANLVTMIVIYMFSFKEAFMVTIIRVFLVGLLSGRLLGPTFYMSLVGGISSVVVSSILKKTNLFGITLVSLFSSISHQVGQILAGMLVIGAVEIIYYLPIMLPMSVVSGILIGIISEKFINSVEKMI